MPFGLQPTHLILILVVALLVFGPQRLPEIGRSFGSMLREFQSATKAATEGFTQEVSSAATTAPAAAPAAPAALPAASTVPCRTCGKGMQPGAKFCPECGASQQVDTPPANVASPASVASQPVETPPSSVA